MPRGDGTGPNGMGPMTGRGAGYCAGFPAPGYMNPTLGGGGYGRGMGGGRGGGYGRGMGGGRGGFGYWRGYAAATGGYPYPPVQPADTETAERNEASYLKNEKTFLERQVEDLRQALKDVDDRLSELDAETDKKK